MPPPRESGVGPPRRLVLRWGVVRLTRTSAAAAAKRAAAAQGTPAARSTSTLRWRRGRGAALSSQTTLGPPASPGALALVAPVALGPLGAPERPPKMSKTPGRRGDVETRRMPGASRMPGTEGPTYAK